ncbi:uncharacterized protein LOC123403865 [Hordeum vulgare subsp. vulgare]|uniref:Predicted protein n=1 Tax=Hordeum vulgare subsp. vulgare TaxID=112509 RepID=F2E873_HORVV|nr:uncharacterized protein LOC123403865 [Hordeum vulgare subsp. vulgare]BAK03545.1 predicted protein [Hordeum vulgare subsp. vulgare]
MAPDERSCAVLRFAADEAAPPETLHLVLMQRLRLRRAAQGWLRPIAEEEDFAGSSNEHDDNVLARSPSAHSSSATVHLGQCRRG